MTKRNIQSIITIIISTCKGLTESRQVEEPTFGHGEELSRKHQQGDGREDHGEHHERLHRLQPVWNE